MEMDSKVTNAMKNSFKSNLPRSKMQIIEAL